MRKASSSTPRPRSPGSAATAWLLGLCLGLWAAAAVPASLAPQRARLSAVTAAGGLHPVGEVLGTPEGRGVLGVRLPSSAALDGARFLVVELLDPSGASAPGAFVPVPPGATGAIDLGTPSSARVQSLVAALQTAETDDPLVLAYCLLVLRAPGVLPYALFFGPLVREAILGSQGFAAEMDGPRSGKDGRTARLAESVLAAMASRRIDLGAWLAAGNPSPAQVEAMGRELGTALAEAGSRAGIGATTLMAAHGRAWEVVRTRGQRELLGLLPRDLGASIELAFRALGEGLAGTGDRAPPIQLGARLR